MSDGIYAWLLRLYPSRFRRAYGDEALQLFRDRARDETGALPKLRLWLDLLADLAISLPREYFSVRPAYVGVSTRQGLGGIPSFIVLGDEWPGLGALLSGSVLTSIALAAFWILLNTGSYANLRARASGPIPESFSSSQPQPPQQQPADANEMGRGASGSNRLDAAERKRVIDSVIENLKQHYIDPDAAKKIGNALRAQQEQGSYDAITDGAAFGSLLTSQLRDLSNDLHLDVLYSQTILPEHPRERTPEDSARYRRAMDDANCTFEKVEILPYNIGYLKLDSFPDPSVCETAARATMNRLNDASAIIFDLRDNHGGEPEMVMLLAAYLFDHPEYMYNPRENTTERSWTRSPVQGNKLADKPAYILTSASTLSGAEHFSYDLKMLKRATLVGETTGGAAHSGVWHRIDDHFGMGISETKPINPFTKSDWAVVGVEPDVKVKAADALLTAEKLAARKLRK